MTNYKFLVMAAIFICAWLTPDSSSAQVSIPDGYEKLIRERGAIKQLGADLFGDQIDLYMGGLQFTQRDIDLSGNNKLEVALGRRYVVSSGAYEPRAFRDWDLDVPHIHGFSPSERDG